jgi:hypothetical protein
MWMGLHSVFWEGGSSARLDARTITMRGSVRPRTRHLWLTLPLPPRSPADYSFQRDIYFANGFNDVIMQYNVGGPDGVTDGVSCAAKCAEAPGCLVATFFRPPIVVSGTCYLRSAGAPLGFYPSRGTDTYTMLPGTCPAGTKSNGTACNPCTVLNCATCDAGSATTCATCAAGYAAVDGQCLPCPAPCATCSDAATCATCPPRQLLISSTGLCTGNGTCELASNLSPPGGLGHGVGLWQVH